MAAWGWNLTPQRHSALGLPWQPRTSLQGVLATVERTSSQHPPRSVGSGGSLVFKFVQGDGTESARTSWPVGAGGGASDQDGFPSPREPLGKKKPQLHKGFLEMNFTQIPTSSIFIYSHATTVTITPVKQNVEKCLNLFQDQCASVM